MQPECESVLNLNLRDDDMKHWFSLKSMALLVFKVPNLPKEGILQDSW